MNATFCTCPLPTMGPVVWKGHLPGCPVNATIAVKGVLANPTFLAEQLAQTLRELGAAREALDNARKFLVTGGPLTQADRAELIAIVSETQADA